MIGNLTGGGWRPGTWAGSESLVTSDISTKSRFRILFTNLGARDATGLNGPDVCRRDPAVAAPGRDNDAFDFDAATARRSSPLTTAGLGVKVGRGGRLAAGGSMPGG